MAPLNDAADAVEGHLYRDAAGSSMTAPSSVLSAEGHAAAESMQAEALQVLDTLAEIGELSGAAADAARAKLTLLCDAVAAAASESSALAQHAEQLERDRAASDAAAAGALRKAAAFEGVSIEILREDVETALAESTLAQERAALMALEQQELTQQRDQLAEHLDTVAVQHAAALAPVIAGLQEEISGLKREVDEQRLTAAVAQQEVDGVKGRLGEAEPVLAALHKQRKVEASKLAGVAAAPEKARRQADLAVADLAVAQQLLAAAETRALEVDAAVRAAHEQERQKQVEYAAAMSSLERARIMLEAKERHGDDVSRDVDLTGLEKERILGDQADIAMAMQALCREVRMQGEQLARARHEKLLALRSYKAAEEALAATQEELPALRIARDLSAKEKGEAQAALAEAVSSKEELRRQVDVRIAAFIKEEAVGKDKAALLNVAQQEVLLLEQESAGGRDDQRHMSRLLADMTAQRDRVARQVAVQASKVVAAQAMARLRGGREADMQSMVAEQERRAADFEQLFDLVRNQRNRFVATIASARQAAAEMSNRLRLLASEQEVLTADVATKTALLDKARAARGASVKEKEHLLNELHSLAGSFRSKHDKLQEQMQAIKRVQGLIQRAQGTMRSTKHSYEAAVQARNATGVMLIDRNDELAALHERLHLQEAQTAAGTLQLGLREDELRVLGLQVAELERSIHATKRTMPNLMHVDQDIAALKADLFKAQQQSSELGDELEDPGTASSRIRLLGGHIPEKEELVAKLQSLEERLGMQQECLVERGIVLEEVQTLTGQLREEAAAARPAGTQLASAANAYAERLRRVQRGMMAAISELSLYQATALKLHATKAELEGVLRQAGARLAQGLPPTADADAQWAAQLRQEQTLAELRQQREQEAAILDAKGSLLVSAAEPRPNAYIPADLGIPKPYGGFSPFKPQPQGATMRHMRKPAPQEVVI